MRRADRRQTPARYAVEFRDGDGAPAAGALVVTGGGLLLTGRGRGEPREPVELSIPRIELIRVRIGRQPAERLHGYSTIVLERRSAAPVLVAPFGVSLLHEVADLLASLTEPAAAESAAVERIALVVPLRRGWKTRVRELVALGPPFEPSALGLRRHDVFLGDRDVVFVFEAPTVRRAVEHALTEPGLWRAGVAWRSCIAGRPHLATSDEDPAAGRELVFSWRS